MRYGGGLRLQNSNPMLLEDVAVAGRGALVGDAQAQRLD
jgi:hypothetical protein